MAFALIFCLFLLASTVVHGKTIRVAHMAPAFDSALDDGWARFVFWQSTNGTISVHNRADKTTTVIDQPFTPRKKSPLSAFSVGVEGGNNQILLSYLDNKGYIIDVACTHDNGIYDNWASARSKHQSASGLAIVSAENGRRRLFIDRDRFLSQDIGGVKSRLGPQAAKHSQLATAVAARSNAIHLFYVAGDKALCLTTFNGTAWSPTLPCIPNFAPKTDVSFAAAAWANPPFVRVFYVDKDNAALREFTLRGADTAWTGAQHDLGEDAVAYTGAPVAASRAENGTGRYLEYFYSAKDGNNDAVGRINYFATNSLQSAYFTIDLLTFDIHIEKLAATDIIGLSLGLFSAAVTVVMGWRHWEWIQKIWERHGRLPGGTGTSYSPIGGSQGVQSSRPALHSIPLVRSTVLF